CPCAAIAIHQDAPDPRIAISTSKRLDTPAAFVTGHQLVPDRGHDVSVGVYCKILGKTRWHALRHAEPTGLAVRKPYQSAAVQADPERAIRMRCHGRNPGERMAIGRAEAFKRNAVESKQRSAGRQP